MPLYLVAIQDKQLMGEPDIGFAIVEADGEANARNAAQPEIMALGYAGRNRCVPHVREIELGRFYRTRALVKPPDVEIGRAGDGGKLIP